MKSYPKNKLMLCPKGLAKNNPKTTEIHYDGKTYTGFGSWL